MAGPPSARSLRVLTVNIYKGYTGFRGRHRLADLREAERADSFPALWPLLRLDHIDVRGAVGHRPPPPRRPWAGLRGHAPVAAEITR
jgi:endonuclease/exonuclease/phosphatase family metal-dependent hydrolase